MKRLSIRKSESPEALGQQHGRQRYQPGAQPGDHEQTEAPLSDIGGACRKAPPLMRVSRGQPPRPTSPHLGIPNHLLDMVAHRNVGTIVRVINPVANDAPPATGYNCQRIYD